MKNAMEKLGDQEGHDNRSKTTKYTKGYHKAKTKYT